MYGGCSTLKMAPRVSQTRAMNWCFMTERCPFALVPEADPDLLESPSSRLCIICTSESTEVEVFKTTRKALKKKLGDNTAMAVSSTRYIEEMSYNASYKIDIAQLQKIADSEVAAPAEAVEAATPAPSRPLSPVSTGLLSRSHRKLPVSAPTDVPLMLAGLNSITAVQLYFWLREGFDYEEEMRRLFEEDVTAVVVACEIVGEELAAAVQRVEIPTGSSTNRRVEIVMDIAHEVARLAKTTSPVPTDVPLMLAGLDSITVVQLHPRLQSSFDYDEDMSKLFEEDCTAESLAAIIAEDATTPTPPRSKKSPRLMLRLSPLLRSSLRRSASSRRLPRPFQLTSP